MLRHRLRRQTGRHKHYSPDRLWQKRGVRVLPKLTLVLGGAASGKSAFAERLIAATARPRVYIATAQASDAEMQARIARHVAARGPGWQTVEAPLSVAQAVARADPAAAVLIDCATLWLSNLMFANADTAAETATLLSAIAATAAPLVVVSNEIGLSPVPDHPLARRFRDEQGTLNQRLAAQADLAVLVVAGLPMLLKGHLP